MSRPKAEEEILKELERLMSGKKPDKSASGTKEGSKPTDAPFEKRLIGDKTVAQLREEMSLRVIDVLNSYIPSIGGEIQHLDFLRTTNDVLQASVLALITKSLEDVPMMAIALIMRLARENDRYWRHAAIRIAAKGPMMREAADEMGISFKDLE